ncbi:Hypothetical protein AA314_08372 [Archangium gephyra]|uniref:Uncharacterized protein n=1 Tax=Archangium gephyra TaxID=48 RepID=A0AAC8QFY7_9BACT|nr:Hypothetical protein AA314_08372 [Archangium gephyra]
MPGTWDVLPPREGRHGRAPSVPAFWAGAEPAERAYGLALVR